MKNYSDEELNFIRKHYPESGPSYCGEKLNINRSSITKKAQQMGLTISNENRKRIHRIAINKWNESIGREIFNPEQFISNITPEASYALGLIWADGCLIRKEIRFCNQLEDAIVFYKILLKTGCWKMYERENKNHPTWKKQGHITASSPELYKHLIDMGYNKDPKNLINHLPDNLKHYWFRGVIDGDGCWYIGKNGASRKFTVAGPYDEDWTYFTNLLNKFNIKYKINRDINKYGKNSTIRICSKDGIRKLGDYIYNGFIEDRIGLNRKYDKYLTLISTPPSKKRIIV